MPSLGQEVAGPLSYLPALYLGPFVPLFGPPPSVMDCSSAQVVRGATSYTYCTINTPTVLHL
jgi:hypothetical protein